MFADFMPLPAAAIGQQIGYHVGQVLLPVVTGLCGAKCLAIAMRPTTSTKAALSLMFVLFATAIVSATGLAVQDAPPGAFKSTVSVLGGLLLIGATIVGTVLAILALIDLSADQGIRYNQGRKQAWTTLALGALVMGVLGWGVIRGLGLTEYRTMQGPIGVYGQQSPIAMQSPVQPVADEKISLDEFGFTFDAPPRPWVRTDSKKISPDSCLGFGQGKPPMYFVVIAENFGDMELSSEMLAEVAIANIKSAATTATVGERTVQTINGIEGIRLYSRARIGPSEFTYVHFVFTRGGRAFQLMTWGVVPDEAAVRAQAEMLHARFHIKEDVPAPPVAATPVEQAAALPPYESPFGYRVHLTGGDWRAWDGMATEAPDADYGALDGATRVFAVVPVILGKTNPPIRAVADGMLARFDIKLASATDVKTFEENGVEILTCGASRIVRGMTLNYRFKILKNKSVAVLASAWTSFAPQQSNLDEALAGVTLDPAPRSFAARDLTPAQRKTHSLVFNHVGLGFYESRQPVEAAPFFELAHEIDPAEHVILENLMLSYEDSNRVAEAAACAIRGSTQFPDQPKFNVHAAFCWYELGKMDQAFRQYRELFDGGYEDDVTFSIYAGLLVKNEKVDEAVAAAEAYRAKHDTVSATVTLADLYFRKEQLDRAIELVKAKHAQTGFNAELALAQADYCLFAERYGETLEITRQLRERGHETATVLLTHGRAQFGLKQYPEAKASFERSLEKDPSQSTTRELLGLVSGILGEGENTALKAPIDPVAIPESVLRPAAPAKVDESTSAIYLNKITAISYVRDKDFRTTEYRHVKVLDPHGVESFSTMEFPFDPIAEQLFVNKLEVRDADGKVVSTGKVSDYYTLDQRDGEIVSQKKVLQIPISGLRPGYTFELLLTRRDVAPGPDFRWTQHNLAAIFPAQQSALIFRGDAGAITQFLTGGAAAHTSVDGATCWIATNPPVARYEPLQKHPSSFLPQVVLGAKSATWESEAAEYLKQITDRLQPEPAVKDLAARLTASAKTESDKIAAISRHVQQDYIYKAVEFGRRARIPQSCADVMQHHFGDCKDHSLLLCQLLSASGIPANLALVRSNELLIPASPSLDQFDHMIVYVGPTADSPKARFFDCTDKGSDLRTGQPYLWTNQALVLDPAKPRLVDIPSPNSVPNSVVCTRDVKVLEHGDVAVKETVRASGWDASSLRSILKNIEPNQRAQSLQKMLASHAGDVVVQETSIKQLEQNDQSLVVEMSYVMKRRFNPLREQLIGGLPAPWARYYLSPEHVDKRETPFEIRVPINFECNTLVHLPAGYKVAAAPEPRTFADAFATGNVTYAQAGQDLKIDFLVRLKPGEHPATAYAGYQQSGAEALRALEQNVVLERIPPGAK